MLDFIPFMVLAAAVILLVVAWGARRAGHPDGDQLERLQAAETAFADCLRERGFAPPPLTIYRDRVDGRLVIFGKEEVPTAMRDAFAECDRLVAAEFEA